jgi:hypothetical protein
MNRLNPSLAGARRVLAILTTGLYLTACGTTTTDTGAVGDTATAGDVADTTAGTDAVSTDTAPDIKKPDVKADIQQVVDNDNTPETAAALTVATSATPGQPTSDTLDPTGDVDYYSFDGKKGDITGIQIQAQALTTAFDVDTLDTIITLYGPDKKQIAFNDDPTGRANNDSYLLTYLPADGKYYVRVEECWTWLAAHPEKKGVSCADPKDKGNTDYNIFVFNLLDSDTGVVVDLENGDTPTSATELAYEKSTTGTNAGKYLQTTLLGTFKGIVDIDVYHFNVPVDTTVTQGRSVAYFDLARGTVDGNGSLAMMGSAWIASEATPTAMVAQADLGTGKSSGLAVPLKFGTGYYLFVSRATGDFAGSSEFYFFDVYGGGSNPLETNDAGNDVATGGEAVTFKADQQTGNQQGFFEGDLLKNGADVDWWTLTVPTGVGGGKFYVYCGAQSSGSGLRSFKVDTYSDAGTTAIDKGSQVEAADGIAILTLTTPADGAKIYLKTSALSQAADVASTFYRCGILFQAP